MIRASVISRDDSSVSESPTKSGDKTGKLSSALKRVSDRYFGRDQYELKSDRKILMIVRSALHSNVFINENNILVNVNEGWVYLEGKVDNEDQRNLAKKLIADIFGVVRVTNYLTFPRHGFAVN